MTVLETPRLSLRQMSVGDAAFIVELLNGPSFLENIGDRGVRTLDDACAYIARGPGAGYDQHAFGLYLVELTASGEPIGICGLLKREGLGLVEIGFAFLERFWKQGYAYESAAAVMEYAWNVLELWGLFAVTSPQNLESIRLLERLGMRFERDIELEGVGGRKLFSARLVQW